MWGGMGEGGVSKVQALFVLIVACDNINGVTWTFALKNPFIDENDFFRAIAPIHRHVITRKRIHTCKQYLCVWVLYYNYT